MSEEREPTCLEEEVGPYDEYQGELKRRLGIALMRIKELEDETKKL
jgi:hypothetical protein